MVAESPGLWQGFDFVIISQENCPNSCEGKTERPGAIVFFKAQQERLKLIKMNLFCFSLEGSTDSLYEPTSGQQANQESSRGGASCPVSPTEDRAQIHHNLFMEVSNSDNEEPKKRKTFRRCTSENKIFEGKTVNDTIWQEPSKAENNSHIRRPCQLKDLNEDGFILNTHMNTFQEKEQGTSYQVNNMNNQHLVGVL
ncbi:hypothetical protein H1C71_041388 [Ictidomys tridecemlineatus]|uniref:putative uncharacterized protein ENSP00000383407 n=1 Tax=Ictidomys tridecemlineatus TaxID=43179 RepID=UPI000B53CB42|nr:putative uncharacterized protein ENSP00000383407 [Ictidomys tridecemlineatus]KAG3283754.1 hypothetical protein H1C71_041388 [Ictidomys tridecemlineatus]